METARHRSFRMIVMVITESTAALDGAEFSGKHFSQFKIGRFVDWLPTVSPGQSQTAR